ncbi:hypothetical protein BCL79_0644 [Stenotrophomonas rhizophila]|uniref:Uncharacterized protein n=2 Tax=Stenotrophomonas rhizophila TaxID=216778 RepID=A0A498CIN1_9GAMM|nr:hypothetical protein BCL79_0644 [Stenotrophomonas rhizophila]
MRHLSLTYQSGLTRNRSLRDHMTTVVYDRGLVETAGRLDMSPSKLTEKLAGQDSGGKLRGMTIDELERYFAATKDFSPIHYLIEKYLTCPEAAQAEAMAELTKLVGQLSGALEKAGVKWP